MQKDHSIGHLLEGISKIEVVCLSCNVGQGAMAQWI